MAVNPWVGYEASAYVVGTVAESELGCTVEYKELKEDVSWQGFGTGEVDVVIEDWGHPDLEKKFFAEEGDGTATDFGPTGNIGIIGWYVPPWLAEEHPDILDWENLNEYAAGVRDVGVRRQGPVPRRRPVVRPVRRGDREQPRPRLQGRLLRLGGRHASRRSARRRRTRSASSATSTSRSDFIAEVPLVKRRAAAVRGGLPGRPADGRLRLPGDRAEEDRLHRVGRGRLARPSTW